MPQTYHDGYQLSRLHNGILALVGAGEVGYMCYMGGC